MVGNKPDDLLETLATERTQRRRSRAQNLRADEAGLPSDDGALIGLGLAALSGGLVGLILGLIIAAGG